jgi:uncharacterized membrane protein YhaH (DUF805 family)
VVLLTGLGFRIFYCRCGNVICGKTGHQPGVLVWIPIANIIPLLTLATLPIWRLILMLIPLVPVGVGIILGVKICEARGKSGWLVILLFVPLVNIVFIPCLALSGGTAYRAARSRQTSRSSDRR